MDQRHAVQLWCGLCNEPFGGEWGGADRLTPFGAAVLGADVPTQALYGKHDTDGSRKKAADWLRTWADALDPSED